MRLRRQKPESSAFDEGGDAQGPGVVSGGHAVDGQPRRFPGENENSREMIFHIQVRTLLLIRLDAKDLGNRFSGHYGFGLRVHSRCRQEDQEPPVLLKPVTLFRRKRGLQRRCCCSCEVASVVSDPVRPHRRQPPGSPSLALSRREHWGGLPLPSPVQSEREGAQPCLTLSDPMDRSPPGSSVRGIFQARALEWGAPAFSSKTLDVFLLHQNVLQPSNASLECPETQHPDGPLAVELKSLELFVLDSAQLFRFPLGCPAAHEGLAHGRGAGRIRSARNTRVAGRVCSGDGPAATAAAHGQLRSFAS